MTEVTDILDTHYNNGTPPAALYVGFVSGTNFVTYDRGNESMSSHPNWEEFTGYAEAARPAWTPGTAIDGIIASINNPGSATITPNVEGSVVGVFLCDNSTKGGTTGQLYGPYPLTEGPQYTQVGVPFKVKVKITLELN